MCRYATKTYKVHFVCFDCRKAFKKASVEDLAKQNGEWKLFQTAFWYTNRPKAKRFRKENPVLFKQLENKYIKRIELCPQCRGEMANLGLDFKAPKKEKVKEWQIIKGLYKTGVCFNSCGCHYIGFVPKKKTEYIEYLNSRKQIYLERIAGRDASLINEDLKNYISRFQELIDMINIELTMQNQVVQ